MDDGVKLNRSQTVRLGEVYEGGVEHRANVAAEVDEADERDGGQHFRGDVAVGFEGGSCDGVEDVAVDKEDYRHGYD